jgi:hypothetical protein
MLATIWRAKLRSMGLGVDDKEQFRHSARGA